MKIKNIIFLTIQGILVISFLHLLTSQASTITQIQGTDRISDSRTTINSNFNNLNTDKIEIGGDISGSTSTPRVKISGMNTGALIVGSTTDRVYPFGTSSNAGYLLTATGASPYISWEAAPATGITSLNGLTGSTQTFATSTGINITSSGSTHTFNLRQILQTISGLATTKGNLILGNSGGTDFTILGVGSDGKVLTASSSATNGLSYENYPPTDFALGSIAKGDLLIGKNSASVFTRLATSTNGYVLTASSTATHGVSWEASSGGSGGGTAYNTIDFSLNPAGAATATSSPAGSNKKIGTYWTTHTLDFSGSSAERVYFTLKFPSFTALNSCGMTGTVFADATTTGNVAVFGISYLDRSDTEAFDTNSSSTATTSVTVGTVAAGSFRNFSLTIATGSIASADSLLVELHRRPSESDDTDESDVRYANGKVICTYR